MRQELDGRLIAAGSALAVAVLLFGSTLVGALDGGDTQLPPAPTKKVIDAKQAPAPEVISMQAVNEAVAVDPFSEERQPAALPYKLPGDPEEVPPPPPPPAPPPLPNFRLVGTTQTAAGGIALIQLDNANPKVVGVGESLNGFVVERIDKTTATLAQGERRMQLQLQQPSSRAATTQQNGRRGGGAGGNGGRGGPVTNNNAAVQQKLIQQMQEMMQSRERQVIEMPVMRVRPDTTPQRIQRDGGDR